MKFKLVALALLCIAQAPNAHAASDHTIRMATVAASAHRFTYKKLICSPSAWQVEALDVQREANDLCNNPSADHGEILLKAIVNNIFHALERTQSPAAARALFDFQDAVLVTTYHLKLAEN